MEIALRALITDEEADALKNTKLLVLIILLLGLAVAVYSFWDICLTFMGAMIFAYLLGPPARFITRKLKIRHGLSVALVMTIFIAAVILLISMSVPYVINQLSALVRDISAYAGSFDRLLQRASEYLQALSLPEPVLDTLLSFVSNMDTFILGLFTSVLQGLVSVSMGLLDLVVVVILIIYFMLDGAKLMNAAINSLPLRLRQSVARITSASNRMTRRYIKSNILLALGMALVTYIGFTIIGIRYAFLFAVLSFVLNFVPYFGSFIAAVIEILYTLIVLGPAKALIVAIFVLAIQQIEGNIVAPRVHGEAVGIHPVAVMFALLACNKLFGPAGMLISTPVAAMVKVIFQEAYGFVVRPDNVNPDQMSLFE